MDKKEQSIQNLKERLVRMHKVIENIHGYSITLAEMNKELYEIFTDLENK